MEGDSWELVPCPGERAAGFRGGVQPPFDILEKFMFSLNHEPSPLCSQGWARLQGVEGSGWWSGSPIFLQVFLPDPTGECCPLPTAFLPIPGPISCTSCFRAHFLLPADRRGE